MLDRRDQTVQSLLVRCLACLLMTTVVNADGRVFVLDLRNSSGLQGVRDAEQACASRHARLASAEELRHSVVECFFSSCTRGWLHGGAVGTTVCDTVGSALKAVDVEAQNATDDTAHLDAFCIKDNGGPCGDPPSFPNAHLQGHTGFEMGDELLYMCVPGYVMPSGQSAFSLLCDSCGEWYGLVQICVKDGSEIHVDYEDRFTDPHEDADHLEEKSEEAHVRMYEDMDGAAHWKGKMSHEQQETGFGVEEQHGEQEVRGEVMGFEEATEGKVKDEERAVQDFTGHPTWQQGSREVVRTDAPAATEAPVSLLSQKHMFWFPSEAFQEEGLPASRNPVTQSTQRASGAQSEESKEQESQERQQHPVDGDDHDHDADGYDDHDADDQDDHNDSHHGQDHHDSRQDEDDHHDHVKHYIPAQSDDLNGRDSHERRDGDHEDDHTHNNSQENDDRDDTDDKHESDEDQGDITEDDDLHASEEHPDHDGDLDENDNDRDTDHDDHYDDLDSHEYDDDGHKRVMFSIATDQSQNITQKKAGAKATTDETWLDGYPVVPEETGRDDSAIDRMRPDHRQRGSALRSTDRPNEVEIRRPAPFTSSPGKPESPTESEFSHAMEEVWSSLIPTAAPPSDSHADPDISDYDTQQETPTDSWLGDLTKQPFLNHDPAPPVHNNDILAGVMEEHTMHSLPGETGERGEMEGERGEATCTGEDCPPRTFGRGPKVAAIIVAVLAVATAVLVGVWCYRRQQQKSSVYEMNGKGQSQSRAGQQMEMQQKV